MEQQWAAEIAGAGAPGCGLAFLVQDEADHGRPSLRIGAELERGEAAAERSSRRFMTCEHCCCERPRTPAALSQVIALSRADGEGEKG